MDQKLKELRETYQSQTSFTDDDRQQVLSKINEPKSSEKRPLFPFKVILPLAAVLLLAFTIVVSQMGGESGNTASPGEGEEDNNQDVSSNNQDEPDLKGYVVAKEDGRILVTGTEQNEYDQFPATWFSDVKQNVELGDYVHVGYSALQESYPSQGSADHLTIVTDESDTNVTKQEAIASVLRTVDDINIKVISRIERSSEENDWIIELRGAGQSDNVHNFSIAFDGSSVSTNYNGSDLLLGAQQVELDLGIHNVIDDAFSSLHYEGFTENDEAITINLTNESNSDIDQESLTSQLEEVVFNYDPINEFTVNFGNGSTTVTQSQETNEGNEGSGGVPEPDIESVIADYHDGIDKMTESVEGESHRLAHYDTKEEIVEDLSSVMSESRIDYLFDTFIVEEDLTSDSTEGLYVRPTGGDTKINPDNDYQVEQFETSYHVTQEINNEYSGHVNVIYIITYDNNNWILDDVQYEQLD
ncbi:hypothetical protein ABID56_001991 [Alkalibacillus flavidus]|uniref:Uncharacterized protein n=1 Tax=Alkalibacillus flavidus TaxID=546021 RepID=A0ABV2KZ86_9BACI